MRRLLYIFCSVLFQLRHDEFVFPLLGVLAEDRDEKQLALAGVGGLDGVEFLVEDRLAPSKTTENPSMCSSLASL